ncbi:DUF5690 family protein [Sphingobacterium faecium]|nr:DUF5690 family protein [Sphingobacterium faecium]MDH5827753.1 DUF5690 family protein [Sphingobacterium faecium]
MFFERMIATYKMKSNIGFVMYLADAIGYLGSFFVLLNKELLPNSVTWGSYFIQLVFFTSIIGGGLSLLSLYYFVRKKDAVDKKEAVDKMEQETVKSWCVKNSDVQIS